MHPNPEDIGFFCAVVIGPRKGKGSQAKGSARNRRGRIPTILPVIAPAVTVMRSCRRGMSSTRQRICYALYVLI
jgi:hypothetical protein